MPLPGQPDFYEVLLHGSFDYDYAKVAAQLNKFYGWTGENLITLKNKVDHLTRLETPFKGGIILNPKQSATSGEELLPSFKFKNVFGGLHTDLEEARALSASEQNTGLNLEKIITRVAVDKDGVPIEPSRVLEKSKFVTDTKIYETHPKGTLHIVDSFGVPLTGNPKQDIQGIEDAWSTLNAYNKTPRVDKLTAQEQYDWWNPIREEMNGENAEKGLNLQG
jgi:hypothetical protein